MAVVPYTSALTYLLTLPPYNKDSFQKVVDELPVDGAEKSQGKAREVGKFGDDLVEHIPMFSWNATGSDSRFGFSQSTMWTSLSK